MEAILLGIYCFFVWLIFIKLKWLPWNLTSQVICAIIPVVGMAVLWHAPRPGEAREPHSGVRADVSEVARVATRCE